MTGPMQRDKDDVVQRIDNMDHVASRRAKHRHRQTPMFYRITQDEFKTVEALIVELGYRSRADFFADTVKLMAIVAKGANDLDYRDREEFLVRSIQALSCWEKKSPIPAWAQLESSQIGRAHV